MTHTAPESFQPRGYFFEFFCTRLSDGPCPEPGCSARVVSLVAMGRRIDRRAYYATAIQRNFHRCFECDRGFVDVRCSPVCCGTRSFRESAGSLAAIHRGFGDERSCHQSRRQNRPCGGCRRIGGTDEDDPASAGGPSRYVDSGPDPDGPGAQRSFRALCDQILGSKDDGRLRARRQRSDRNRQAASAGSLRDLRGVWAFPPLRAKPDLPSPKVLARPAVVETSRRTGYPRLRGV